MGCGVSRAEVLGDSTFDVDIAPTAARDFLATPENWLRIIPRCSGGEAKWVDAQHTHFSVKSADGKSNFHYTEVVKYTDGALAYVVHVGEPKSAVLRFKVELTFTETGRGCTIRWLRTDYVQLRHRCIPIRPVIRHNHRTKEKEAMACAMMGVVKSKGVEVRRRDSFTWSRT